MAHFLRPLGWEHSFLPGTGSWWCDSNCTGVRPFQVRFQSVTLVGGMLVLIRVGRSFLLPLSDTYTDEVAKLRCLGQGALLFPKMMSKEAKFKVYFVTWTFTPVIETGSSALENGDPQFVIYSCFIVS